MPSVCVCVCVCVCVYTLRPWTKPAPSIAASRSSHICSWSSHLHLLPAAWQRFSSLFLSTQGWALLGEPAASGFNSHVSSSTLYLCACTCVYGSAWNSAQCQWHGGGADGVDSQESPAAGTACTTQHMRSTSQDLIRCGANSWVPKPCRAWLNEKCTAAASMASKHT